MTLLSVAHFLRSTWMFRVLLVRWGPPKIVAMWLSIGSTASPRGYRVPKPKANNSTPSGVDRVGRLMNDVLRD
uniref:Secreted protein n=1 Tax=Cannabis sativa TaxID=3483 RepID=A0A803PTJ7_CANSA